MQKTKDELEAEVQLLKGMLMNIPLVDYLIKEILDLKERVAQLEENPVIISEHNDTIEWHTVIYNGPDNAPGTFSAARCRLYITLSEYGTTMTVSEINSAINPPDEILAQMTPIKRKKAESRVGLSRSNIDKTLEVFWQLNYITKEVKGTRQKRFSITSNNIRPSFDNRKEE